MPAKTADPLLSVEGLCVEARSDARTFPILQDVSFDLHAGETLSIVGESGSGKSMTLRAVLGLLPPGIHLTSGRVDLDGNQLVGASERQLRSVRGGQIGMIFQDPMTALNPVMTIGEQIDETLKQHSRELDRAGRRKRIVELLDQVRLPNAASRLRQYPHEFSGGMRQRTMIAMAMANRPRVLLADEPTTALDVTVQAQILDLLKELQQETGAAIALITHDLGVVAEVADRAVVLYAGRIVESGPAQELFEAPVHPYLRGLLDSRPAKAVSSGA
ncbi:MAG: ABC transporter ATP-binding protein, partial [Propionibacteriaceae bacterium]|nr:ABC transporter ATP-binding protein [Propionibacteriaceae bacterium]